MPYTNTWDDTVPSGTVPANTIDDHIRRLRLDIHERLEDSLVVDLAADPLVMNPKAGGAVTGKQLIYAYPNFAPSVIQGENDDGYLKTDHAMYCSVSLPPGVSVTAVELLGKFMQSLTWEFKSMPFSLSVESRVVVGTCTTGTGGIKITTLDLSSTPLVTDGNTAYYIHIPDSAGFPLIYALRITYNTPDHLHTI